MIRYIHLLVGIALFGVSLTFELAVFEMKALGIAAWMVYWWISQPVPLYITALLPIIVGPACGLASDVELAQAYGNKMVFLFFGGFVIALGIEKRALHKHFAQWIIQRFGNSPSRLLLSFMLATAFLSMWISNTATALMMLPMGLSVIASIPRFRLKKRFALALLLSIAYAANIGGTATLIGTPPNVQLAGILDQQFNIKVDFLQWLMLGFPFMLIAMLFTFFMMKWLFLRKIEFEVPEVKAEKMTSNQKRVLAIFLLVSVLWILSSLIGKVLPFQLNDTMIALAGAFLMFIVPAAKEDGALLKWKDLNRLPWGILFLFGGGLALASILANGQLVEAVVGGLEEISSIPVIALLFFIFLLTIFSTELMSNLALVSLLLPVIGEFALSAGLPLFHVCAGVALCSSCAFMLPISTPPNAIVYSSNMIKINSMIRVGLLLNLLTVLLVTFLVYWMVVQG